MEYLIGQKFGGQKIRRTKFFGGQNFRHQLEISAILSKTVLTRNLCFCFLRCQNKDRQCTETHIMIGGQKISADKNFGGQNFSADKIFGAKPNFRQFCPPNFCPIRYIIFFVNNFLSYISWF